MSSNSEKVYSAEESDRLLDIARHSITHGFTHNVSLPVPLPSCTPALREPRACFVTLQMSGQLRGCIGSLEARMALAQEVSDNAYRAAFLDPRFDPLTPDELGLVSISVSVLAPAIPLVFTSESDLIKQLRPGIDGLILECGRQRGTFLPSVWDTLSRPEDFWHQLKIKTGLRADYWSDTFRVSRYTTIYIEEKGR